VPRFAGYGQILLHRRLGNDGQPQQTIVNLITRMWQNKGFFQ
jgi:hypothetical protein